MSRAFDIGIESLAQANTVTPASAPLPAEDLHPSNSTPPPSPGKKSFYLETFGCQMNVHDSEKVAGVLLERGYRAVDTAAEADFLLYNTCSIREKAAQKVFSAAQRFQVLRRRRTAKVIGVLGCVAQQEGEEIFERAPWVSLVCGSASYRKLAGTDRATRSGRAARHGPRPGYRRNIRNRNHAPR